MEKDTEGKQITLKEIVRRIVFSKKEDWEKIRCVKDPDAPPDYEEMAYYKPDRAIVLAWDFNERKDFVADWIKKFQDRKASTNCLSIIYKKEVLQKIPYVDVDGLKGMLPIPETIGDQLCVFEDDCFLVKKLSEICMLQSTFDQYFKRVNFEIIRETKKSDVILS